MEFMLSHQELKQAVHDYMAARFGKDFIFDKASVAITSKTGTTYNAAVSSLQGAERTK